MRKLTCQEVIEQLAEYLDEEAHAELVAAVDLHLGGCGHCRIEVDQLRSIIRVSQGGTEVRMPESLVAKLAEAMRRAYGEDCGGSEGDDPK